MKRNREYNCREILKTVGDLNLIGISLSNIKLIPYENEKEDSDRYYYEVTINGGLNGHGNWMQYLYQIQQILSKFIDATIVEIKSDVIDDVWTMKFTTVGYEK